MLEVFREIVSLIEKGEPGVLATVIRSQGSSPRQAGARMLIRADGSTLGTIGGGGVEHMICQQAPEVARSGAARVVSFDLSGDAEAPGMICGGQMEVFLEPIAPPETLYLFGAGHIGQAVSAAGKRLGFRVVVVDPRPDYANRRCFPEADRLVVQDYAAAFGGLAFDPTSYIIIFTPGHAFDAECLELALATPARYIGMIGSQKKVASVKQRLMKKGISEERLARVHSPIGLEIGAETPEEIAISILAEIVQVRRGGGG